MGDILSAAIGLCIGLAVGGAYVMYLIKRRQHSLLESRMLLDSAERDAESIRKEAEIKAKDEVLVRREKFESEMTEARREIRQSERRITKREESLDRKFDDLERKEQVFADRERGLKRREEFLESRNDELQKLINNEEQELLRIASMSKDEAIEVLMKRLETETSQKAASIIERVQEETKEKAEELAQKIVGTAVQRIAVSYVSDTVTSVVDLPSDEMKGRIIGREGRNIRAIEKATGVDIIVDDTPGVIVVSCFDNVRREVARRSIEMLIKDGRIHPARIEELVTKVQDEIEDDIKQTGKRTLQELELHKVHPQIAYLVGRLKYRTSYGQNVLKHSIEVGYLMSTMAAEMKLDPVIARRCGLFHDIGKAMTHEVDGSHALNGADVARRCDESRIVWNAIGAHHEEMPFESLYAVLTQVADGISAGRPGARRDTIERYIQRLEKLEEVASGFDGVKSAFAIQAGREVRVLVDSAKMDDDAAIITARNIAKKIEDELTYPGEVRVTLIRETRVIEIAH